MAGGLRVPLIFQTSMSSVLEERSATAVHATLTALVRTNAAASPAWADYEAVLLDPATASFFEARLSDAKALVDSESNPPPSKKKKRKRDAASDADESDSDADDAIVCEHCGGPVPQVSLRVASLDGTTLVVTVAQRGLVREVKRLVGQVSAVLIRDECTANA